MPTDYNGSVTFHSTIQVVSDGDKRSASNINAAPLALQDNSKYLQANKLSKLEEDFALGPLTIGPGDVTIGGHLIQQLNTRRPTGVYQLADDAEQTINPNIQATNLYRGVLTSAASRIVRLDTANVVNGDWVRIFFAMSTNGAGVWQFRRGASALNIASLDLVVGVTVEFQRIFGLWRLVTPGPNISPGPESWT